LDKKEHVKNKNKKDYENLINSLDKMPELVPNKELCDIAKEELKKFSEDGNYNKYQIIINEGDSDKKGRNILNNKEYTYIGIIQSMTEGDISIILIFTKENCLNNSETLDSQESNESVPNDSDKKKKDFLTKIIIVNLLKMNKIIFKK